MPPRSSHRNLTWPRKLLLRLCVLAFSSLFIPAANAAPMNFVFLLVDDLGWADLGCYGSDFHETPNIDQLSRTGMRFTQAYAACPVCSPTRASIMTGRHPVRVDITDWIPGMNTTRYPGARFLHVNDRDNLALSEVTIAEALKKRSYQTFFAGKWHLGDKGHWPTDQGFDHNIGGNAKGSPPGGYYSPWKNPTLKAKSPDEREYVTERLTAETVSYLRKRDPDRPFFAFLSYYNVHTPITKYEKRGKQFQEKAAEAFSDETPILSERRATTRLRQDNPDYASMIAAVDDSVGQILATLEELQLTENTVIVFFSDNGGLSTARRAGPTCNLPLRAGKGWLYEGGVREPMIVRAPGITAPGSTCDSPVVSMDFFPTILELADAPLEPQLHADGQSLLPLLSGATTDGRTFHWHYPHYHGSMWAPGASIRDGDWKLIEFYHEEKAELYNLAQDPGEANDLSNAEPAKLKLLRNKLTNWQQKMNARMPQVAQPVR